MHRYEAFAAAALAKATPKELVARLDELTDAEIVAILAGSNARTEAERYRRNVITTELMNRLAGKAALLDELLPSDAALTGLSVGLARALRVDVSCFDEVRGQEFVLHGRNNLPEGSEKITRCHRDDRPDARHRRPATQRGVLRCASMPASRPWILCRRAGVRRSGQGERRRMGRHGAAEVYTHDEVALVSRIAARVAQHLAARRLPGPASSQ